MSEALTVTYDFNGGTIGTNTIQKVQVGKGDMVSAPSDPIRAGYVFDGWYTDTMIITQWNFSTSVISDITLYAKWVQGFTSIAAFATWLAAQPLNTPAAAYNIKLNISDLGGDSNTSGSLGSVLFNNYDVLTNSGKYVNLDLSGSTFETIPYQAFYDCHTLVRVAIPSSVTATEPEAFTDCYGATAINVDSANNDYSSQNGILYNKDKTTLIAYPPAKTESSFSKPNIKNCTFCLITE
jgi:uncharacterized repeat protein (TIGR02543 family)